MNRPMADDLPPLQRARRALGRIRWLLEVDEGIHQTIGHEAVLDGLEVVADALAEAKDLDVGAPSLDEVLAEIGAEDSLMETAADLIYELGQVSYGVLPVENGKKAVGLLEELYDAMDALLSGLEQEQGDG